MGSDDLFRKRKVATRDRRPRILIVCEGEKTEPKYFESFRFLFVFNKKSDLPSLKQNFYKKSQNTFQHSDFHIIHIQFLNSAVLPSHLINVYEP